MFVDVSFHGDDGELPQILITEFDDFIAVKIKISKSEFAADSTHPALGVPQLNMIFNDMTVAQALHFFPTAVVYKAFQVSK